MDERYAIVRTEAAGVFAGFLQRLDGTEATLRDARRLWYWAGAASLSQLAVSGTSKPAACKFPAPVSRVELRGVIEVLDVTSLAQSSIEEVAIWRA